MIKDTLQQIFKLTEIAKTQLENDMKFTDLSRFSKLVQACEVIEERYKDYCDECDDDFGSDKGTCYREGVNMEFYIEASDWHQISLALRDLTLKEEK